MTYSAGNEQLNINSIAYEYDLNGNRIRKTEGGVVTNYTYDDENRLRQVTQGSTTITYAYDPFGRRIEKNVNGNIKQYVYDNEDIILECATSGTVLARYTHGPGIDEPLAVQQGTAIYYYHADGLGSIAALSNTSGATAQYYRYDAFGRMTQSGSVTQPYMYTAREYDAETGLYYYRARYYDPVAGRFITRDPIGVLGDARTYSPIKGNASEPNTMNLILNKNGINHVYSYVSNNPVNMIDPSGLYQTLFQSDCCKTSRWECWNKCMSILNPNWSTTALGAAGAAGAKYITGTIGIGLGRIGAAGNGWSLGTSTGCTMTCMSNPCSYD